MTKLDNLFAKNKSWAEGVKQEDPEFFGRLGCSDSRVPANQITGLMPGEVFVHRNIANVVSRTDLNCLSVVQYAVEVLKVKHIIICGHYGCGGVTASIDGQQHGLIDNWLQYLVNVYRLNRNKLDSIEDPKQKLDRLCELNVVEGVYNISQTAIVKSAWDAGQDLSVHGIVYDIKDGILKDLDVTVDGPSSSIIGAGKQSYSMK
jgi:carbonic anhydrase